MTTTDDASGALAVVEQAQEKLRQEILKFFQGNPLDDAYGQLDKDTLYAQVVGRIQQQASYRTESQRQARPSGTAPGRATHNTDGRISTDAFWGAYSVVGYNRWGTEESHNEVWKFIGGNIGKSFYKKNTCATRVSYGLNYGGQPVTEHNGTSSFTNDPGTRFNGKRGDGKNYIIRAGAMHDYLRGLWGTPNAVLKTGDEAAAFARHLPAGQGAIFAGTHHSGFIKDGYRDPYVFSDPGVLPVDVWELP